MYSVIHILEGDRHSASEISEAARVRFEVLGRAGGFATFLAIRGEDGALVTVEIFETRDDMETAEGDAGRGLRSSLSPDRHEGARTIAGEIVFQRGL